MRRRNTKTNLPAIKEGIKEGERKRALKTAMAALREGADVDFIAKITGLDPEVVRRLKAKVEFG